LAHKDSLAVQIGGEHQPGVSNILDLGKLKGVQRAWSEGLATYLGIATQYVTHAADAELLPNVPNTLDTRYNNTNPDNPTTNPDNPTTNPDNPTGTFWIDLETSGAYNYDTALTNQGEGDEVSVMRILWDIADGKGKERWLDDDDIGLGHKELYDILKNKIPQNSPGNPLDQLDDVWDYFYGISNDANRTKFGAIFEEYGVSPRPYDGPIGQNFNASSTLPTFKWERENYDGIDDANDDFQVIVFNRDFSKRLLESEHLKGEVTQWTPSIEDWAKVVNTPGIYRFIVAGSDTDISIAKSDDDKFATGSYWSGAYKFSVGPKFGFKTLKEGLDKTLSAIGENLDLLISGLGNFLPQLQGGVDNQLYANKLPLLGDLNSLSLSDSSDSISSLRASSLSSSLAPLKFITEIQDAILDKLTEVVAETLDPLREILSDTLGDILNVSEITNDQFKDFLGNLLDQLLLAQTEPTEEELINTVGQALSSTFNINAQNIDDKIEDFLVELNAELTEQLNGILGQPLGPIQQAFLDAVGPDGINILKDSNGDGTVDIKDVAVDVTDLSGVKFDLNLGTEKTFSTSLATDIGFSGLGLEVDGDAQVDFGFNLIWVLVSIRQMDFISILPLTKNSALD